MWPITKKPCRKDVKSNGQPRPPALDRYKKSFSHDVLTQT